MARKNYEHYADLYNADNPQAAPDGALLRAVNADNPPWCVTGHHGENYFHTLSEAKKFCCGYEIRQRGGVSDVE